MATLWILYRASDFGSMDILGPEEEGGDLDPITKAMIEKDFDSIAWKAVKEKGGHIYPLLYSLTID